MREGTKIAAAGDLILSAEVDDLISHLPLRLIKSETIPPAPNRGVSAIDWLPDFAGYAWIAYGASSCLVISHFPSPLSSHETLIGPICRQVFELSAAVTAVAWSPVSPSSDDLAAALENRILPTLNSVTC